MLGNVVGEGRADIIDTPEAIPELLRTERHGGLKLTRLSWTVSPITTRV